LPRRTKKSYDKLTQQRKTMKILHAEPQDNMKRMTKNKTRKALRVGRDYREDITIA